MKQLTPKYPEFFSAKAKDFIGQLLQFKASRRISLAQALEHPFLNK